MEKGEFLGIGRKDRGGQKMEKGKLSSTPPSRRHPTVEKGSPKPWTPSKQQRNNPDKWTD